MLVVIGVPFGTWIETSAKFLSIFFIIRLLVFLLLTAQDSFYILATSLYQMYDLNLFS